MHKTSEQVLIEAEALAEALIEALDGEGLGRPHRALPGVASKLDTFLRATKSYDGPSLLLCAVREVKSLKYQLMINVDHKLRIWHVNFRPAYGGTSAPIQARMTEGATKEIVGKLGALVMIQKMSGR
jgi:hypothetical protein